MPGLPVWGQFLSDVGVHQRNPSTKFPESGGVTPRPGIVQNQQVSGRKVSWKRHRLLTEIPSGIFQQLHCVCHPGNDRAIIPLRGGISGRTLPPQ